MFVYVVAVKIVYKEFIFFLKMYLCNEIGKNNFSDNNCKTEIAVD